MDTLNERAEMIGCLLAETMGLQDLQSLGLKTEWAQDRNVWRSLIRGNRPTHASMEQEDAQRTR